MKFEFFIANRLKDTGVNKLSKPILNIATWGISLGITVMILTVSIVKGFQKNVSQKVIEFSAPISINKITSSDSYEMPPINIDSTLISKFQKIDFVDNIQTFAQKAGVIKVESEVHGIILKGLGENYNQDFLATSLESGRTLSLGTGQREILISSRIAALTNKSIGDKIKLYFISRKDDQSNFQQRMYPFKVIGIYNSGLSDDFDNRFVFCDIKYVNKLNYWSENQIGGYEVLINPNNESIKGAKSIIGNKDRFEYISNSKDIIYDKFYDDLSQLKINTINSRYPQIFDWLSLFDTHIITIITIITIISIINIIAVLFIILIEKTSLIGILKALGANSSSIRKIFILKTSKVILKGILYGNLLGLGLCYLQSTFKLIKLDESVYYTSYVPIEINGYLIVIINIITIISCILSLVLPSNYISKLSPSKSIRFS